MTISIDHGLEYEIGIGHEELDSRFVVNLWKTNIDMDFRAQADHFSD